LIGVLAGGGSLFLVAWTYKMLTGKDGMGGGDIKLLAMIGALIGWQGVLFTIFSGSAIGTVAGIIGMIGAKSMSMKLAIPFGPFLSSGAVLYIFYGHEIIHWYFNILK
jgi:leader peptidase (prepilin peptidase)/N-methyltransferase